MPWSLTAKRMPDAVMKSGAIVEERYVYEEEAHLTVRKTSLFFAGDGFTAYDCKGELVFRVDSYGPDAGDAGEVVLMDASGRCILTVRRKRPSLHQRWEGFVGEGGDGKKPLFSVRRSSIIGRSSMTVEVYTKPGEEYQIEGSFGCRNCNIFNSEKAIVAEVRRKVDATTNVVLGKDVFVLSLKPGFDAAFAMGLVLILDQIYGSDEDDYADGSLNGNKVGVEPTSEDSSSNPSP
ncbi:protein LURP-one-related 5-like [Salvia divinorum]|uniref:Protein LURP-one-related 5-like n=1 Tax=Salvia divinorum TaxID=28513 RepID=A0ABD1IBF5_SALDI